MTLAQWVIPHKERVLSAVARIGLEAWWGTQVAGFGVLATQLVSEKWEKRALVLALVAYSKGQGVLQLD